MTRRQMAGIALLALGIVVGYLWASGRITQPFSPVVALFLFLAGAGFFVQTGRLAGSLRPFVGKNVHVRVWGSELPGHAGRKMQVHAVRSLGAGLHLYLRPLPDGSPVHLKVAQPLDERISDHGTEIARAKYVQWAGKKIEKDQREKAFVLIVETDKALD